jgi:hypothetical protein
MSALQDLQKLLQGIREKAPSESESSSVGQADETAFEEKLKRDKLKIEIQGLRQDISERKCYASKTFTLICCWLAGVFLVLILQGFLGGDQSVFVFPSGHEIKIKFCLGDNVLIAVVGGTTASVIGIFVYVVKYLFSKH